MSLIDTIKSMLDPNEWFESEEKEPPSWEDTAPSEYEPPTEAEMPAELLEVPTSVKNPKPEKKEKTIHEEMYQIATARYNPFSLGGSENCDSDVTCNIGGSENLNSR